MKILSYLKALAQFYDSAIKLYFPKTCDQQTKQKTASQHRSCLPQATSNIAGQPYTNFGFVPGVPPGQKQMKDEGLGGIADIQKLEAENQRSQKYWKHVIRKVLY